eukprot:CAMPEP_0201281812 /NCGR_PEP_ID=MMETSP1317-20130820/4115_1 /ASSEMBLY_ACC=CAM_ASM_000770 /TAXON_ID=187299 /ORGANISM="Undescribed Undescribed, Strain Undescribed" /LENGTH=42 /DNA_ID= /DNA_START= /DNA_END= /DNA_ORIENTATION=
MEDLAADQEEMNEILNRNYAVDFDEDELDRELEALNDEAALE